MRKKTEAKKPDGRKNNKGVTKIPEERKVPLTFHVMAKNKPALKAKYGPKIEKDDK